MRNLLLFLMSLTAAGRAIAQQGIFIRAQAGAGSSVIKDISQVSSGGAPLCDCGYHVPKQPTMASVGANVEAGYQFKLFRVATGVQLVRTSGFKDVSGESIVSGKTYSTVITDRSSHYDHVFIPLTVGAKINVAKHVSLIPELGAKILFLANNDKTYSKSAFNGRLLTAKMNIEYSLSYRLSATLTPAYYSLETPVYYTGQNNGTLYAYNHAFLLQAGVTAYFNHKTKEAAPAKKQ